MNPRTRVALGFRAHSGWAALVAIAGSPDSPAVIDRRRIELAEPGIPASKQPYHAAAALDLKKAEALVRRSADRAKLLARRALGAALDDLKKKGHEVAGCGILLRSGRPLTTLAATLASHALIHTAEGDLFRDALHHASQRCGLTVMGVKERELYARGAAELGLASGELQRHVTELGRPIGPPWRQDEKQAALVGWLVLAAAARQKPPREGG